MKLLHCEVNVNVDVFTGSTLPGRHGLMFVLASHRHITYESILCRALLHISMLQASLDMRTSNAAFP